MLVLLLFAGIILLLIAVLTVGIAEGSEIVSVHWITGTAIVIGSYSVVYRYGRWFGIWELGSAPIIASLLICQSWAIVSSLGCGCETWDVVVFVVACVAGLVHDLQYTTAGWPSENRALPSGLVTSIVVPLMIYARITVDSGLCIVAGILVGTACLVLGIFSLKR